jgi:hypothetical protein
MGIANSAGVNKGGVKRAMASAGWAGDLQPTAARTSETLGSGEQQLQGDELFVGQKNRHREHHPSPGAWLPARFSQHNSYGVRSIRTALHVPEDNKASGGEQLAAVDTIQAQ